MYRYEMFSFCLMCILGLSIISLEKSLSNCPDYAFTENFVVRFIQVNNQFQSCMKSIISKIHYIFEWNARWKTAFKTIKETTYIAVFKNGAI